jgi:DNA-directed RNA polymerase specialized sigma24 family protein
VRAALERMEARDVTILGLHYLEDLTYQQIAETLRISAAG